MSPVTQFIEANWLNSPSGDCARCWQWSLVYGKGIHLWWKGLPYNSNSLYSVVLLYHEQFSPTNCEFKHRILFSVDYSIAVFNIMLDCVITNTSLPYIKFLQKILSRKFIAWLVTVYLVNSKSYCGSAFVISILYTLSLLWYTELCDKDNQLYESLI